MARAAVLHRYQHLYDVNSKKNTMFATPLVFSILVTNLVLCQTDFNVLSEVKTLRNSSEAIFAVQIQTTSEKTPAAFAGNNLNVVGLDVPSNFLAVVRQEKIRTILPLHPTENVNDGEKNRTDQNEAKRKLLPSLQGNYLDREKSDYKMNKNSELGEPENLVWENCFDIANNDTKLDMVQSHTRNIETEFMRATGNILNKRNSLQSNNFSMIRNWLDKYNSLKSPKSQEPTSEIEVQESSTSISLTSAIEIVPFSTKILNSYTEPMNMTFEVVTEYNQLETNKIDWYMTTDKQKIKFGSLPQTQTYLIPKFKLDEGFHPFSFMSKFFSVIYLFEYPVGLAKEIVKGKFSFPYSFLQSIKIESTFLVFIIIFGILALIIPLYLFILSLISLFTKSKCTDEIESGTLFLEADQPDCHDKILVIFTFLFFLISCALISGMVISNEQSRMAVAESRNILSCACADIASWISAAAQELYQCLIPPVDMVFYAYIEDLRNVETLLGQPIQQAIASESGIDLVIDSLADIIAESEDLSIKVTSLRETSTKASLLATAASEKISDLTQQLDSLRIHCVEKDAPLCDTLRTNTLHIMMKFDSILREEQLLELNNLGVVNLTQAISTARKIFRTLPTAILSQTEKIRTDILRDIENRKKIVHNAGKILNDIVRHLTSGLHSLMRHLDSGLDRVHKYELWRWTIVLACNIMIAFVMMLVLLAMCCGCGNAKIHAKRTLQVSSFCLCIVSIILWAMISVTFLVSGYAEVYACQILWEGKYETLSTLLDRPSPLLGDNEGIFDVLFRDLYNVTIDVPIKNVLRECEKNEPAYTVFQLEKILDVNKETSYFEWDDLQDDLQRLSISIDVGFLKTISENFNKLLNRILVVSDVNLTEYRMEYNGPVVGKDLPSFVDQLENVASQVSDLNTAGRLETLATRTQRIHTSNIKPLEQLRSELVFKLTELELQMMPFRRKLNISLSHIHTAQFYINNQGDVIAQKKLSTFTSRLISHMAGWRTHVLAAASEHAGRCGPLFAVFSGIRTLICTKYVSSLHGWWFCGFCLGFIWCTVFTPLCVKLWRSYDRKLRTLDALTLTNIGQEPGTPATATCDDTNWNTPGPPPLPQDDSW